MGRGIRHSTIQGSHFLPEVVGFLSEAFEGIFTIFEENRCQEAGTEKHLVEINEDGVCSLDFLEEGMCFFERTKLGVSGIDMEPKILGFAKVGNLIEMIKAARGRGAGTSNNSDYPDTAFLGFLHRVRKKMRTACDRSDRLWLE